MILGSTRPGGTSKRSRARLRLKNSAELILAGSVFSIGSFKKLPSPPPHPPTQKNRPPKPHRTSDDPPPLAPHPRQPDRNREAAGPCPPTPPGRERKASARPRTAPPTP